MLFLAALLALHLAPVSPTAPNRQPQLAASSGTVALVFGSGEAIWFARSDDDGRTFSSPVKIGDLPKLMLGRHRGPRVALSGDTIVVSAISSDLYSWRSTDGGRTWSKPLVVNDQAAATNEGLHAMAADAEGHVAAAWLDHRGAAKGKQLWGAFSNDRGATWSKNALLYDSPGGTICECCAPSLVALGHGEFAVMWRNVLDGSRDLYTLRLRDGKPVSTAARQGTGTWKLDACPMDGGGIAVHHGAVISAWRREHDIYVAESGKPETRAGTGQDVALAATGKGPYAIWSTAHGIEVRLPASAAPTSLSETGAFPSIVALPGGGVLAAWEENGHIAIRRLE